MYSNAAVYLIDTLLLWAVIQGLFCLRSRESECHKRAGKCEDSYKINIKQKVEGLTNRKDKDRDIYDLTLR